MSERAPRPAVHASVFVKLVGVMMTMTLILLVMVGAFFGLIGSPNLHVSERLVEEYARALAMTAPSVATAKRLSTRLDVQVRYEGPDGTWTTDANLPAIAEVRNTQRQASILDRLHGKTPARDRADRDGWRRGVHERDYYLVSRAGAGTYLFSWDYRQQVVQAHATVLWILLGSIMLTVLIAYAVIRHLLRPLRSLGDGVARLSDGQLDVVLPNRTRDEFGALTEAFNQMVRRVRQMVRRRDQLLLDVSHELRSPLTRMKVALELLPDDTHRARMAADVAEMEAMIAELLELERLRDGRGIRTARRDLMPILIDVVGSFQDRAPGVRVVSPAREVFLDLDEEKVRIVLRNLLENAFKYSLPDSRAVEVSVAQPRSDTVTVRVRDDGPGIPEEDLASLFEPFFRVDRSRSKSTGGYGLGLSICKRVMEAHGGSIAVDTQARRGASFVLTFPTSRAGTGSDFA